MVFGSLQRTKREFGLSDILPLMALAPKDKATCERLIPCRLMGAWIKGMLVKNILLRLMIFKSSNITFIEIRLKVL